MKKPILATVGVAGACAACCAIPILVPLASGLSVAGVLGLDWLQLPVGRESLAAGTGIAVALVAGGGIWIARKRQAANACASSVAKAGTGMSAPSCGCGGDAKAAPSRGSM